jgi:hypothetical protein
MACVYWEPLRSNVRLEILSFFSRAGARPQGRGEPFLGGLQEVIVHGAPARVEVVVGFLRVLVGFVLVPGLGRGVSGLAEVRERPRADEAAGLKRLLRSAKVSRLRLRAGDLVVDRG